MSIVDQYRDAEAQLKALQAQLASLENNDQLLLEMEFDEKLRSLLGEYGKSLIDVIAILDPSRLPSAKASSASVSTKTRRPRAMKIYTNPHNGEVIETKGGNHNGLKAWKAQYGSDVVEGWLAQ